MPASQPVLLTLQNAIIAHVSAEWHRRAGQQQDQQLRNARQSQATATAPSEPGLTEVKRSTQQPGAGPRRRCCSQGCHRRANRATSPPATTLLICIFNFEVAAHAARRHPGESAAADLAATSTSSPVILRALTPAASACRCQTKKNEAMNY